MREDRAENSQIPCRNRCSLDDRALITFQQLRLTAPVEPHPQPCSTGLLFRLSPSSTTIAWHGGRRGVRGLIIRRQGCLDHHHRRRRRRRKGALGHLLEAAATRRAAKRERPLPHSLALFLSLSLSLGFCLYLRVCLVGYFSASRFLVLVHPKRRRFRPPLRLLP